MTVLGVVTYDPLCLLPHLAEEEAARQKAIQDKLDAEAAALEAELADQENNDSDTSGDG